MSLDRFLLNNFFIYQRLVCEALAILKHLIFHFTIPFVYIHNLSFNNHSPNALYTLLVFCAFYSSFFSR